MQFLNLNVVVRIVIVVSFLFHASAVRDTDFCAKKYRCFTSGKFLLNGICQLKHNCGIGPNCERYENTFLTDAGKKVVVDKHNELRNMHALEKGLKTSNNQRYPSAADMRELVWDKDLEFQAQCWANQCPTATASCLRKSDGTTANQHIWWSSQNDLLSVIQKFYDEGLNGSADIIDKYEPDKHIRFRHFTQLVWANTSQIGCGRSRYYSPETKRMVSCLVCNYAIKGNLAGLQVYIKGPPCTQCPDDTPCHPTYTGLCSTKESNSTIPNICKHSSDLQYCDDIFAKLNVEKKNTTTKIRTQTTAASSRRVKREFTIKTLRPLKVLFLEELSTTKTQTVKGGLIYTKDARMRNRVIHRSKRRQCAFQIRFLVIGASLGRTGYIGHNVIVVLLHVLYSAIG